MPSPIDVETLWQLERVASVGIAPDGSAAVCAVTTYSMKENQGATSLWLLPTASCTPRRLTRCGEKDGRPAWSPQGDRIAFLARREQEGRKDSEPQLYLIDAAGGEAERRSSFLPGIEDFKWMPDGRRIAFVSWVWPGLKGSRAQDKQYKAFSERKESAHVTAQAQYRHFDRGLPMGRVPHLLVLDLATRRVTAIAADESWNFEAPRYSPDGARLACIAAHVVRRHTMPGRLAFLRIGEPPRVVGNDWRIDVEGSLRWAPDAASVLFAAQESGRCHLWRYHLREETISQAAKGGWVQGFDVGGLPGDETIVVAADCAAHPVQVQAIRANAARRIERFNDERMARVTLGGTREVTLRGALGDDVQMFVTFPPRFDPRRKYPVLHVIHGGPYTAAGDSFGYRWNSHLFASRGYVVAAVNYHGSSGFGFAFRDSIVGRQGRLETQDIEAATDWLLAKPWVDPGRVFASGGSYGGFLVAWMNGHVAAGRYRAYVCHAGVFDRLLTFCADSYAQRPKDLGALYWENAAKVRSQSPSTFAHRMDTPTLVIHGNNDYRVPDANGLAYYNTLQARGVPARLVWFPDENHWVLKPCNSRLWYSEVFDWLAAHDPRRAVRLPWGGKSRTHRVGRR